MKKVAILTGGLSSERAIALESARSVQGWLEPNFEVVVFDLPEQIDDFITQRIEIDCAVPIFHGKGGEDGVIQGFLKTLNMPMVFSDVTAHAVALDKWLTKRLIRDELKTPPAKLLQMPQVSDASSVAFATPVVVKPADGGSSLGISLARNQEELDLAVAHACRYCDSVLIENLISGREFTVAVIEENDQAAALPVIEIKPKDEFFSFETKYDAEKCEEICPAQIDENLVQRLQKAGVLAHETIGARHLSRSDFIVDDAGEIWFLEINTIPGQTINSLVPKAIQASGRKIPDLFAAWIAALG